MRDTILAVIVIGVLLWSVASMKTLKRIAPGSLDLQSTEQATHKSSKEAVAAGSGSKFASGIPSRQNRHFKGDVNERHRKLGQKKIHPKSSGPSGDASEIAKLTSIYAPEKSASASHGVNAITPGNSEVGVAAKPAESNNGETAAHPRGIPGVPVQAFLQYNKNSIRTPTITAPTDAGLRVYVNCMEVKEKGFAYTGEKRCGSLLNRSLADRRPVLPVGPQPF